MAELDPIISTSHITLDLPPSCMQFCPLNPTFFVVGTYNLEASNAQSAVTSGVKEPPLLDEAINIPQSRDGSLLLFQIDNNDINLVQTEPQPAALLDLKFHPIYQGILAAISSTGSLAIYDIVLQSTPALGQLATSRCEDLGQEILFLQCNWHPSISNTIAVTTSTGLARLLYLDENWRIEGWTDMNIHNSLEAWSISFSPVGNTNEEGSAKEPATTAYCGGDDSILRYTSYNLSKLATRQEASIMHPAVSIKGQHDAGVTAILPLSCWTHDGRRIVLTGSYDDHLRVFGIHDSHESHEAEKVRLLGHINLGGGVWRLKLIDAQAAGESSSGTVEIRVLASCMHAGVRIVTIGLQDGQMAESSIVARFEEHKSMNYACDSTKVSQTGGLRCISTSFYDKLLCLWDYDTPSARNDALGTRVEK